MKMFDAGKTRMIGLLYNAGTLRTDGRTDKIAISKSRVSVLTRDKNENKNESNFIFIRPTSQISSRFLIFVFLTLLNLQISYKLALCDHRCCL